MRIVCLRTKTVSVVQVIFCSIMAKLSVLFILIFVMTSVKISRATGGKFPL